MVLAAVALLGLGVVAEAARIASHNPWGGFVEWHSDFASSVYIVVWSLTAVSLLMRHRSTVLGRIAWFGSFFAPLTFLVHSLVSRLAGDWVGLLYLVAAPALMWSLRRSWDGGVYDDLRARILEKRAQRSPEPRMVWVSTFF